MRLPDNVICKMCKQIFCCSECRYKHEVKSHAIAIHKPIAEGDNLADSETIYIFCPICEQKPFALHAIIHKELLDHIKSKHLPLHCQKCGKLYKTIDDLKEFSKCVQSTDGTFSGRMCSVSDQTCDTDASKVTVTKALAQTTISTQTSPQRSSDSLTPMPLINFRWKTNSKLTHKEFISDSASSIRNISSFSNSSLRRNSIDIISAAKGKGKLVRSTSTPVHSEIGVIKPKEQAFNASGGHVSSIYNSASETDISPAVLPNPIGTPSKQSVENKNRYRKVGGRAAVTPLRHVMSKSIQKAFAEHGGLPSSSAHCAVWNRKKMFSSIDTSSITNEAVDLRLSPAIRRTHSVICDPSQAELCPSSVNHKFPQMCREILLSSQKLTTESIVITRTEHLTRFESTNNSDSSCKSNSSSNSTKQISSCNCSSISSSSIFKTCRSVEIITSTELSEVNIHQNSDSTEEPLNDFLNLPAGVSRSNLAKTIAPLTPIARIPGAVINKKIIKFETPKKVPNEKCRNSLSPGDVFLTPNSSPVLTNLSPPSTKDAVKKENPTTTQHHSQENFTVLRRPSIKECTHTFSRKDRVVGNITNGEMLLFTKESKSEELQQKPQSNVARFWSLMSSVLSLRSLKGHTRKVDKVAEVDTNSNTLIKRCASIAGSLVCSKPLMDEEQLKTLKRKRTHTLDNQSTYISQLSCNASLSPNEATTKRFRIQPRKPIALMRLSS